MFFFFFLLLLHLLLFIIYYYYYYVTGNLEALFSKVPPPTHTHSPSLVWMTSTNSICRLILLHGRDGLNWGWISVKACHLFFSVTVSGRESANLSVGNQTGVLVEGGSGVCVCGMDRLDGWMKIIVQNIRTAPYVWCVCVSVSGTDSYLSMLSWTFQHLHLRMSEFNYFSHFLFFLPYFHPSLNQLQGFDCKVLCPVPKDCILHYFLNHLR